MPYKPYENEMNRSQISHASNASYRAKAKINLIMRINDIHKEDDVDYKKNLKHFS